MNQPAFNEATIRNLNADEIHRYSDHMPRELLAAQLRKMIESHENLDADEIVADYIDYEVDSDTEHQMKKANELLSSLIEYIHIEKLPAFTNAVSVMIDGFDTKKCNEFVISAFDSTPFDSVYVFDKTAAPSDIQHLEGFSDAAREWAQENYAPVLNSVKKQITHLTELIHQNEHLKSAMAEIEEKLVNEL